METALSYVVVNQDKIIKQQADEIERLRDALHNIYRKTSDDHIMQMVDDALQQNEAQILATNTYEAEGRN